MPLRLYKNTKVHWVVWDPPVFTEGSIKMKRIQKCNGCGKTFQKNQHMLMEGVFYTEWEWGFFSRKDGEHHSFSLCEECYDRIVKTFVIPVTVEE